MDPRSSTPAPLIPWARLMGLADTPPPQGCGAKSIEGEGGGGGRRDSQAMGAVGASHSRRRRAGGRAGRQPILRTDAGGRKPARLFKAAGRIQASQGPSWGPARPFWEPSRLGPSETRQGAQGRRWRKTRGHPRGGPPSLPYPARNSDQTFIHAARRWPRAQPTAGTRRSPRTAPRMQPGKEAATRAPCAAAGRPVRARSPLPACLPARLPASLRPGWARLAAAAAAGAAPSLLPGGGSGAGSTTTRRSYGVHCFASARCQAG